MLTPDSQGLVRHALNRRSRCAAGKCGVMKRSGIRVQRPKRDYDVVRVCSSCAKKCAARIHGRSGEFPCWGDVAAKGRYEIDLKLQLGKR